MVEGISFTWNSRASIYLRAQAAVLKWRIGCKAITVVDSSKFFSSGLLGQTVRLVIGVGIVTSLTLIQGCHGTPGVHGIPGHVDDEARVANRAASSFPAADEDYFHDMDGGIQLTADEVKGRNTWIVWTAGNDRMWDFLTKTSVGNLDFLKTISSYPTLKATRDNRWEYLGLLNEPCMVKATGPDPKRYGLWLDHRDPNCGPDPFENEQKYPGVKIGARGKNIDAGSYYGYATGIVGLRLFPNPDFDEAAAKKWDANRYYNDPKYYLSKDLIRPYRVGMSCGFCHVGPNPISRPPIQTIQSGKTLAPMSAHSISGLTGSLTGIQRRAASSSSSSIHLALAPWILRLSQQTTSTIQEP